MRKSKVTSALPNAHTDEIFFREAIAFTARETKFRPELIEKDYYCSVVLAYLYAPANRQPTLAFKGGTSLNKIHVGFYRLSEDLDFSMTIRVEATKAERSRAMKPVKALFSALPNEVSAFRISQPIEGRNQSKQYVGELAYTSVIDGKPGTIQVEVALREPHLMSLLDASAHTLLLDPFKQSPVFESIQVRCLSRMESFAEKLRAALSRREPAIRDFFDIAYAIEKGLIELDSKELLTLTKQKLAVPENELIEISDARVKELESQLESELRPVLQEDVFRKFAPQKIIERLREFAAGLG